jgi:hypothetical protein
MRTRDNRAKKTPDRRGPEQSKVKWYRTKRQVSGCACTFVKWLILVITANIPISRAIKVICRVTRLIHVTFDVKKWLWPYTSHNIYILFPFALCCCVPFILCCQIYRCVLVIHGILPLILCWCGYMLVYMCVMWCFHAIFSSHGLSLCGECVVCMNGCADNTCVNSDSKHNKFFTERPAFHHHHQ